MKFKKIIIPFLILTLMFIFNINVNAYTYTHSYINPNRSIDNVNAATYAFYNIRIPPGEYQYYEGGILKSFDRHFKILTFQDFGEYTEYAQFLIYFDEISFSKVKYNDYYYIYFQKYRYSFKKYRQNNTTKEMYDPGGLTQNTLTGSTSFSNNRFAFRLKDDYTSLIFNQQSPDFPDADALAISGFSPSTFCYSDFYEISSSINLLGELFDNESDIENPRYFGITLVDKQEFIDWIIENQKYMAFADYGITTASDYIDDVIDLYEEFNTSPLKFYTSIPGFLISNGSIFANVDKAKQLYNLIDNLYQEFKISQQQKIFEVGNNNNLLPHQRINPNTDNPIYIEDINDTLDIKLLREILKTLIQTPNLIYDLFDYYLFNISSNVSLIADYISQIPEYLSTLIYNKFITPINSILDAINNIDISSGGDVTNIENNYITNIVNYLFVPTNTNKFNEFKIDFDLKFNWINQIQDYPIKDFDFDTNTNEPTTFINMNGMTYNLIDFRVFNDYRPFIHGLIIALSYYRFLSKKFKNLSNIIMARTEEKE